MIRRAMAALAAIAALLMAGCGTAEPKEVDIVCAAAALREAVAFEDELSEIDAEAVAYLYAVPDGVKSVVYCGSGATAEELALFDAGDDALAEEVLGLAHAHIEAQLESFKGYNPGEVDKLERAVVERFGRYVALCVSSDTSAATEVGKIFR